MCKALKLLPLNAYLLLGSQCVQFTEALWPGSVVNICADCAIKSIKYDEVEKKKEEEKNSIKKKISDRRGKKKYLRAENRDGVLGTKGDQIGGAPWDVVDDSVATCSYENSIHFHFTIRHGFRTYKYMCI